MKIYIKNSFIVLLIAIGTLFYGCYSFSNKEVKIIDLSGDWTYQLDSLEIGIKEMWYKNEMLSTLKLPGSLATNNIGEDISTKTKWTGSIFDSSWYTGKNFVRYRQKGNIKIPFWLTLNKHYVGVVWYKKTVDIPSQWDGRKVNLFLERPHWETQVWVNNTLVGKGNSLGTPHNFDITKILKPGKKNAFVIRVDNSINEINPGLNSHSISDHTQTNWNGIVGEMHLSASPLVSINGIRVYPDAKNKKVNVKVKIGNLTGKKQKVNLTLLAKYQGKEDSNIKTKSTKVEVDSSKEISIEYNMGDAPMLWDEFSPHLYDMEITIKSTFGIDKKQTVFGLRDFKVDGDNFSVNGQRRFLRGTLECSIFPKTGFPTTNVQDWKRIMEICKAHGLNHIRFHSWCPPEAAFQAADEVGLYLQVEASSWANFDVVLGDGKPIDNWVYQEADDILNTYGNHPSFCMMLYGNEPGGKNQHQYLTDFIKYLKSRDNTKLYTSGAGWPQLSESDYHNLMHPRIQGWGEGLKSVINAKRPNTQYDWSDRIKEDQTPLVSHEIGQWCVYPNFKEISKYTGVLKAKNFEIFKETLESNHLGYLADSLVLASGKLQTICYKADIEAALRTKNIAGFQLLDLHDFPGQGTALVGILDAFWDEKGYVSPSEFKRFCNYLVPLARFKKRIFSTNEPITASVEVANFGPKTIKNVLASWTIVDSVGNTIQKGNFDVDNIPLGNNIQLGNVSVYMKHNDKAQKITFTVVLGEFSNSWDLWVYPQKRNEIEIENDILIVNKLNNKALKSLKKGGKVLLTLKKGSLNDDKGGDIGIGFSSIFWNTAWTNGQKPHTLGILCNPNHPAFSEFPTEYHSNWQWWDAMSNSNAIILDEFSTNLKPIIRVVDDWVTNRRLALIFETTIGNGKLLVSGIDFNTNIKNRPAAKQLLFSLKKYMSTDKFNPTVNLKLNQILELYQ